MRAGIRPRSRQLLGGWQRRRLHLGRVECRSHGARDAHPIGVGIPVAVPLPVPPAMPHRLRYERWSLPRVTILEHAQLEHAPLLGVWMHQLVAIQADHYISILFPAPRRANV